MRVTSCIGIDYELNNVGVAQLVDKQGTDIDLVVRENLPFVDTVRRIDFAPGKGTLSVSSLSGSDIMLKPLRFPGSARSKDLADGVKNQFAEEGVKYVSAGRVGTDSILVIAATAAEKAVNSIVGRMSRFGLDEPYAVDLRVLALWRGAKYFDPSSSAKIIIEETPGGARVVAGRDTVEFAREITGDNIEFELRRSVASYKADYTDQAEVLVVGDHLPADLAAVGMALFPFMEPKLDFLSRGNTTGKKTQINIPRGKKKLITVGALAWLLLLAAPWGLARYWDTQAQAVQKSLAALTPSLAQANQLAQKTKDVQGWTAVLKSFRPAEISLEINDLRYALPKDAWLTEIDSMEPQSKSGLAAPITGFNLTGYADSKNSIAAFRDNLALIPWVQSSTLVSSAWDDKLQSYGFTISITSRGGAVISNAKYN